MKSENGAEMVMSSRDMGKKLSVPIRRQLSANGSPPSPSAPAGRKLEAKSKETPAMKMLPWSALACWALSGLSVLAMIIALAASKLDRIPDVGDRISWHARSAILLIVQSVVLEVCILISSYTAVGIAGNDLKPTESEAKAGTVMGTQKDLNNRKSLAQHNFGDSCLILLEYLLKLLTAIHFVTPESTIAYKAPLSPDPERFVYPVRHLQWAFGVPFLVLLSNRAFLAGQCSEFQVLLRSLPSLILSGLYCVSSCAMEVTNSYIIRNCIILLVLTSYIIVCIDQVSVAFSVPNASSKGVKMAMLGYQLFTFTLYALLYFAAYMGFVNCSLEQSLYTYMDASVKVLHGCFLAMVRNYEDIRTIQLWWRESVAARRDFERLVSQAKVPIFRLSLKGNITGWNDSLVQLTGLAAEAVDGMRIAQLLKKECAEPFQQAMAKAGQPTAQSGSKNALEILFRKNPWGDEDEAGGTTDGGASKKREGVSAVLIVNVVQKLSRDGALEGYVAIGQDVTEMCELKAIEQKKVQLMAVVSHELRSPLHGMIGLSNMMEQGAPNPSFKRQCGMVRCCANRLLDLVTNVMDMTESEQRQRKGLGARDKKSLVNFIDVAEEVTVMTSMATDKAGKPLVSPEVTLKNRLPELQNFPVVLGNPYKCTQLLYNLVTNACKFTTKGSVTLSAKHKKDPPTLEIYITDTGAGISKDALQRIFMPFEQDHGSTADSRSFQGMGLGLAVCKEAVRLHGGSISVESELGKGSTFIVALPCEDHFLERKTQPDLLSKSIEEQRAAKAREAAAAAPAAAPAAPQPAPAPQQASGSRSPARPAESAPETDQGLSTIAEGAEGEEEEAVRRPLVLSVDDDEVNQEVIKNALEDECDIAVAMNGNEALDYLKNAIEKKQRLPDVILLDIQMPGLTGYDVLAEIRAKYSTAHSTLPVIMVSAKAPMETTALKSYTDGCSDFLAKPFHTDLLKAKVHVAVQIKKEIKDQIKASVILDEAARIAQTTAKEAAVRWEQTAKAAKETLDKTQQRLDEAERRAEDEVRKASKASMDAADAEEKFRTLSLREEHSKREYEREMSRLREELDQARSEARSEARSGPATAAVTAASSAAGSPSHRVAFAGDIPEAAQPPRQPPMQPVMSDSTIMLQDFQRDLRRASPCPSPSSLPTAAFPSAVLPSSRPSAGVMAPWLYEQLADREQQIMGLQARLAAESGKKGMVAQQLEVVIQAATYTRGLLEMSEQA